MSGVRPVGEFCVEDGLEWYRIDNYDLLDPFLINVIAPHDQWLFASSSGAITAGRHRADNALFPYETEDRLHRSGGKTGPFTLIRVEGIDEAWEPFAEHTPMGKVHRSIAKTSQGDRLRFQEHNPALGLTFCYTWSSAVDFGLIRTCELAFDGPQQAVEVDLLDGLIDVLPAGVELSTQKLSSSLVDAYRRSELDSESGLALFTLEALITDKPDPAESLRASVVWSAGLENVTTALSERQIRSFRSGENIQPEHLVTGRKGAFLVSTRARLDASSPLRWTMVADVGQDHAAVVRLLRWLRSSTAPEAEVAAAADTTSSGLIDLVASADAQQETGDRRAVVSHFTNVLYNCMRGGVPVDSHRLEIDDFSRFVASRNRAASTRLAPLVKALDPTVERDVLRDAVAGDIDLSRLLNEYLPLALSRRHGDPSRPWNSFNIGSWPSGGTVSLEYEGNWRDIFQNWEALIRSFPGYAEPVVAKFLNASTMDGYNPYRITSQGIEWETPEEGSWSNFGYWGDHQIVYLHRLLDAVHRFHPGLLEKMLPNPAFSYANVPYRILPYDTILEDPKYTLEFDHGEQARIDFRVAAMGSDGKLVLTNDGQVHHASLAEKLLVPALAKLSNLVPGAGIWLNTQRPEWNDANNALVGNGVSVVTVFHLRDYLAFIDGILERSPGDQVPIGLPVIDWLRDLDAAFSAYADPADTDLTGPLGPLGSLTAVTRRRLMDRLGTAASRYRSRVYGHSPGQAAPVGVDELRSFIHAVRPHLDNVTDTARRPDGLVDAYRLLRLGPNTADSERLYLMLEGQVAALGSSATDPNSVIELVDNLFRSRLYRPDQASFLLYPFTPRPPFLHKNRVPNTMIGPVVSSLLDADTGIVSRDINGIVRFGSHLRCARDLTAALDELDASLPLDRAEIMDAYEAVFNHWAFTGRSQTMYRYEGLGSVYWHMVAKLLLALQERIFAAVDSGDDVALVTGMIERYRRIRAGLGDRKTVANHGAFPLDPHSHTPAHSGAQQPGPTGAAKEGVLLRWGELGVRVEAGSVRFQPIFLANQEFLTEPRPWAPLGPGQALEANTLGFTYCGIPIVYHRRDGELLTHATHTDGEVVTGDDRLDRETSRALFARKGAITRVDVWLQPGISAHSTS